MLDVWYFMLSTTMCMSKFLLAFIYMTYKQPGYVEADPELNWAELVEKVPSKYLCFECKVIKPPRSHHCQVCNKCVDRWEAHSFWTNNCVGRQNSGYYFAWVFYVWLNVFLLGWIAMDTIGIPECQIDHCIYAPLCVGCNNAFVHYFVCWFDMIVCFGFMIPASYHLWIQCCNFGRNETTYERFTRKNRQQNLLTKDDSFVDTLEDDEKLLNKAPARRGKLGCWENCGQMCCNKKIISQKQLMKCILADLEYSELE